VQNSQISKQTLDILRFKEIDTSAVNLILESDLYQHFKDQ